MNQQVAHFYLFAYFTEIEGQDSGWQEGYF
jgi:hypothetical protein